MLDQPQTQIKSLPDVASEGPFQQQTGALDLVGMSGVEVPIQMRDQEGVLYRLSAKVDAYVSLDNSAARGIHMSRLFKEAQDGLTRHEISLELLGKIINQFLASHVGLSDRAKITVNYDALLERAALKSANKGWRTYPVRLSCEQIRTQAPRFFIEVFVTYSSTCPASAALSRQLIQQNFKSHFTESLVESKEVYEWLGTPNGINATPHAQRSYAKVEIEVDPTSLEKSFDAIDLIDLVEAVLQTPVQTLVKREDEQEFALRNGQNLMFCEDAARRVQKALEPLLVILDYRAELRHVESLHPHDAVAHISKRK